MASAITTQSATNLPETDAAPAPLEFLSKDFIHEDNQSIIAREQQRWRLLEWHERVRLKFYVGSLARQLHQGKWNPLMLDLARLRQAVRAAKTEYHESASDESRLQARERAYSIIRRARKIMARLRRLYPVYARYQHFAGWLDYERRHREALRKEARLEKRIRKDMEREAAWLEKLMLDVFRKTAGCHYIYKDRDSGMEICKTPRFERSVIKPDAHYFYLAASRRTLFGTRWLLPYGVTIDRLIEEEVVNNLRAATKRQVDTVWAETGHLMFRVSRLDSPDALPRLVRWRDAMQYFPDERRDSFPYTIGVTEGRKFQWFDFMSADPHILVAGKSGSGKSILINNIIGTLVSTHSPSELRLKLIDMKGGMEFTHWHDLPHVLGDVVKTVEDVKPELDHLVNMMRKRMDLMEKVRAKHITTYNSRVDEEHRLARVLIVVDEMANFVGLPGLTEEIHNQIMLLVNMGRAVGFHLILATQHPEVKVVPSRVKTNTGVRMSGAMPSHTASQVILDNVEAARLPSIPGRFAVAVGMRTLVVQAPHITDEDIAGVVSSARLKYPDVPEILDYEQPKIKVWDEQRVITASIEWFEGQMSADRLHKILGDESPGERELRRIVRRIDDHLKAYGFITREDGSEWKIKRKGKAKFFVPVSRPDAADRSGNTQPPVKGVLSPLSLPEVDADEEAQ